MIRINEKGGNPRKIIADLQGAFEKKDDRPKAVQLLKGLIYSDDETADEFLGKINTAITSISKGYDKKESSHHGIIRVESDTVLKGTGYTLEKGDLVYVREADNTIPVTFDQLGIRIKQFLANETPVVDEASGTTTWMDTEGNPIIVINFSEDLISFYAEDGTPMTYGIGDLRVNISKTTRDSLCIVATNPDGTDLFIMVMAFTGTFVKLIVDQIDPLNYVSSIDTELI